MKQYDLDITADRCPLTFVKTKLLIERMAPGDVARVRLKGEEPLENVPRSVREHGHEVLSLATADDDPAGEVHVLVLRKC
jgi:TusA-related sulfurtransferase